MTFHTDATLYNNQLSLFQTPMSDVDRTIIRTGIRFYNSTCKSIPYPVACKYFKYYKKLYWSASYLLNQIEAGIIVRDDTAFIVQYKDCTRGSILSDSKQNCNSQYCMSFRAAQDHWNVDPVVVISKVQKTEVN